MTSREEMLETIFRAYDARASEDTDQLMSAFHSDAAFELKGDRKVVEALGRRAENQKDIRQAMEQLTVAFKFLKRDIVYTVVEGERAVVHSRVEMRFEPTNTPFVTDILDVFTFRDGKIVQLEEFADTAMIKHLTGG